MASHMSSTTPVPDARDVPDRECLHLPGFCGGDAGLVTVLSGSGTPIVDSHASTREESGRTCGSLGFDIGDMVDSLLPQTEAEEVADEDIPQNLGTCDVTATAQPAIGGYPTKPGIVTTSEGTVAAVSQRAPARVSGPPMPWRLMGKAEQTLELPGSASGSCEAYTEADGGRGDSHQPWKDGECSVRADSDQSSTNSQASTATWPDFPAAQHPNVETLMIKNIPCRCTQKDILAAIADLGFGGLHDFCHVPNKRNQTGNVGYAFVSFPDAETTARFAAAVQGYRFPGRTSSKSVEVAPARIQGVKKNLEFFQQKQSGTSAGRTSPVLSM